MVIAIIALSIVCIALASAVCYLVRLLSFAKLATNVFDLKEALAPPIKPQPKVKSKF